MNTSTMITLSPDELEGLIERSVKKAVDTLREDRLIDRNEVRRLTGRSNDTIVRMVKRGVIREYQNDKERPRYLLSEILKWKQDE